MKNKLKIIRENFRLASLIGENIFQSTYIFIVSIIFPIEHRLGLKRKHPIKVNLIFKNRKYYFFVKDSSDIAVLKEVFLLEEYKIHEQINPNAILDLGSNIGASLIYFSILYPNAKIIGVEADPQTFKQLKINTQIFSNIKIINCVISKKSGLEKFYIHPSSRLSSSTFERIKGQKSIEMKAISLQDIIKKFNLYSIDIVKFDIEGAEFGIFDDYKVNKELHYLIGEIHEDIANKTLEEFLNSFLNFKIIRKEKIFNKRYIVELVNQEKYNTGFDK